MKLIKSILILVWTVAFTQCLAAEIILHKKDATIWLPQQRITGEISGFKAKSLTIHHNKKKFKVKIIDNKFRFDIQAEAKNTIWASYRKGKIQSAKLLLVLGYQPVPVVKPVAEVNGEGLKLSAVVLNNPDNKALGYRWYADKNNPQVTPINNANKPAAIVPIPEKPGIYYYNLLITSGTDSVTYRTYVNRTAQEVKPFNIDTDHAPWINEAIIYQITPNTFVKKGGFAAITAKLTEIQQLGINTIYLQPVTKTEKGGQGYDVMDYLAVDSRLGNTAQLKVLIDSAKVLGLKVILDLVPNHTSVNHPYALDCVANGTNSHYFKFYQHANDKAPYSSFYHIDANQFVYYFWHGLINLDYTNPEVQQWMTEVCKYWVREFDIDGYRFDAVWGMNARAPQYARRLRTELKIIKPELLLLAEDKATDPGVYTKGFDAAYDWTADTTWVSQWTWQTTYHDKKSLTVFNLTDSTQRAIQLYEALFRNTVMDKPVLRFMENNDLPRFINTHNQAQTKMAAGLLFALPGMPLLFNGQEVARTFHPYSSRSIFQADKPIQSLDSLGIFHYYQQLISLRKQYPALVQSQVQPVNVTGANSVVALHRYAGSQHFIVLLNVNGAPVTANIDLNQLTLPAIPPSAKNVLTSKGYPIIQKESMSELAVPLEGYSVKWLLLTN
ncbi:alpha-amylase family glycosyl hydrolase [Adhaeribacter arboris]|uniref:alpha-amylase family glycosyl hydrolase n=1 Tax=Adhaeribacter arboris TaxID=2072846 RepID=UPI0011B1EFB8|nr:alpha-amylase family glycosyl hydrolase [Adhaeribacter arboris]